jgi:hypothetical protein
MKSSICRLVLLVAASLVSPRASEAQLAEFYVGIDSRTAPFTAPAAQGGGAYPDNPNLGRLTLLYSHGDHFHGLGVYTYSGPAAAPTLAGTSSNNHVPELSAGFQLPLSPGAGVYAGKHVTAAQLGVDYSNLEMRNVQSLSGVDNTLFNSSTGRWNAAFPDADVHLKLLGVSSPALNVGSLADPNAISVGGDVHLGEGSEMFSFTPVLWVDASAPAGIYTAEFQLIDPTNSAINSGRFFVDVTNVPEPGAVALAAASVAGVITVRRRSLANARS